MIKAIALDLDNTLLTSAHVISEPTKDVLRYLHNNGIKVILCSGRPYRAMQPFIEALHLTRNDDVCVCFNGGLVRMTRDHLVLSEVTLEQTQLEAIYALAKQHHFPLDLVAEDDVYTLTELGRSDYRKDLGDLMTFHDVQYSDLPEGQTFHKVIVRTDEAESQRLEPIVQSLENVTITRSRANMLEILPEGTNKQKGIARALRFFHIPREQLAAFGDAQNDISMLEYAGIGVAMGNATSDVKAIAATTTGSNDEDGIADFLIDYFHIAPTALPR